MKVLVTGVAGYIGGTVCLVRLDEVITSVILANFGTGRREFARNKQPLRYHRKNASKAPARVPVALAHRHPHPQSRRWETVPRRNATQNARQHAAVCDRLELPSRYRCPNGPEAPGLSPCEAPNADRSARKRSRFHCPTWQVDRLPPQAVDASGVRRYVPGTLLHVQPVAPGRQLLGPRPFDHAFSAANYWVTNTIAEDFARLRVWTPGFSRVHRGFRLDVARAAPVTVAVRIGTPTAGGGSAGLDFGWL